MKLLILGSLLAGLFSSLSFADDARVTHTLSQDPPQATVRFEGREIKAFEDEALKQRKASLEGLFKHNAEIYDSRIESIQVVKSSDSKNLIYSGVRNGLAGAMFEAYANHIPLTLRPDDVWLAIAAAFGRYVNYHPEQMRKLLANHDGKRELVVEMDGSLRSSDESFWNVFTDRMLQNMRKLTPEDLSKWLVPDFSTTTARDRFVGQILVMGAMKEYFSFTGILLCGLTELTLKGTLKDWKELRARAAKLADYGEDMKKWAELLLPVLDQFVAAYQGQVDEPFWQKMITYKRLGSGSQKEFRGWFLVFAPFNKDGEYFLNSKEEIASTGIYATVKDSDIQFAATAVPVRLNDNGKEHSLIFWGGVSLPSYDAQANRIRPSVDWAIIDKQVLPKETILENLKGYVVYEKLPESYRALITAEEFNRWKQEYKKQWDERIAKSKAAEKAADEKLLKEPKEVVIKTLVKRNPSRRYETLQDDFKALITKQEYDEAVVLRMQEYEELKAKIKASQEAMERAKIEEMKKLPKVELIKAVAGRYLNVKYENLAEDLRQLVTKEEFEAAQKELREKYARERDWQ